jgi:hypothetical protein
LSAPKIPGAKLFTSRNIDDTVGMVEAAGVRVRRPEAGNP